MSDRAQKKLDKLKAAMAPKTDVETPVEKVAEPTTKRRGTGALLNRETALSKVASGKQRNVQMLMHDPARIRIWEMHNRNYALLSAARCSDLIEGFKRAGRQEFPAIVRRVTDNPDYDFELICGARRRWTATHLGWDLLVEVRELNDRQAFTLQDLENRDREDISDYERSLDYAKALPTFFENNRASMARYLEIDKGNFARLLDLATLPKVVVDAYADMRELKVHHGAAIKRLLNDPKTKRRVLDRAKAMSDEALPGKLVLAALKRASKVEVVKAGPERYGVLSVTSRPNGSAQLTVDVPAEDRAKHLASLRESFELYLASLVDPK